MGIYPQPNAWQCGPFALKHALLALGIVAHEDELAALARATVHGADEDDLARAARRLGCHLETERWRAADPARQALVGWLTRRRPVLLCIEQWNHWVTVVGVDDDAFIVLDTRFAGVFLLLPWSDLERLWRYQPRGRRRAPLYDLHPLLPRGEVRAWARFSRSRAAYLRRPENRDLARGWADYVAPLLDVSCPPATQAQLSTPFVELLGRHRPALLDGSGAHADADRARRRLLHVGFVADTYALEVAPDLEPQAVATVARLVQAVDEAA